MPDESAEDQETIEVCPHCDSSSIMTNSAGGTRARKMERKGKYRCYTCGGYFDEPNTRERRGEGNRCGLAGRLSQAKPDDVSADNLVTDGGEDVRTIQIGQKETFIRSGDTVVELFDRIADRTFNSFSVQNTVLCRPYSDGFPTIPDEEDYISYGLEEVDDGDKLELYRLPVSRRPAYDEALRADGGQSMSDECNCIMEPDEDRDDTVCNAESPEGNLCGKPDGHDGKHAACNIATHPVEVWGGDD